ncbi:MAG: 1-aminocyclopropane-1-carboxylate deaminase [Campylobacterota bacterium]
MASIAALCRRKGWLFLYITKVLSTALKQNKSGNLKAALSDGMELLEVPHNEYRDVVSSLHSALPNARMQRREGDLVLAQGGADLGAKEGVGVLAEEISVWQFENGSKKLTVVTPSGTGTTACFLATSLPEVTVVTTPLIGSKEYLEEQIRYLGTLPSNLTIVDTQKKYRFGKTYAEYITVYQELLEQGIEMDLLYAPKMLIALSEELDNIEGDVLYIHSGGVKGNSSMLERYASRGL